MPDTIAPTLLIGLGGIGSHAVEKIYTQIPNELHPFVAVQAFDTNVNDIRGRQHLKGHITQTSRPITVGDYLLQTDDSVRKWFPDENRLLWRKTLTEGAGQVRAISRLGYRAALQAGCLTDLDKEISRIFLARGDDFDQVARVVIVSSLAGGTGAGMFLQTALYLRYLLEKHFSKPAVLIRGAFLLPDALIQGRLLDRSEYEDVRANAYACFKELNALTRYSSSPSGQIMDPPIDLEFRPGQKDEALSWENLPFDYCFLYDFENSRGGNLGDFENYLNQVANTVFLQLFSPMQKNHFSEEDNAIRGLIKTAGMNRYCGAGVASLIYPKEDVVEYCALRWAESSLKDEWLKLDEAFEQEKRDFEKDIRAGVYRDRPELGKRYIALLEQFAKQQGGGQFFRLVWNSTRVVDKNGRELGIKAHLFLTAVEDFTREVLNRDEDLALAASECHVDEGKLQNKDHAKREIQKMELALELYQEKVFKSLPQHKMFILNSVFFQDRQSQNCLAGSEEYRLNRWIQKSPDAMHPVGVRYFLYQIMALIDEKISELNENNLSLENRIKDYTNRYDDKSTERDESAEDRLRQALSDNFLKKIMRNRFKEFTEEYLDGSSQQLQQLNLYKENKLLEIVLKTLKETLSYFQTNWERYFAYLKDVQFSLLSEIAKRSKEHEGTTDPYRTYVLASKDAKEKLWESLRSKASFSDTLPEEISQQIYQGQYRRTCDEFHNVDLKTHLPEKVEEMFRKDVLAWCREKLKADEGLDFNVMRALQKESETDGINQIKSKIRDLDLKTKPFVPIETEPKMEYWGLNPDILTHLTDQEKEDLFGSTEPSVVNKAFSPYQILRYRASYGLLVEDFPKFSSDPRDSGIYFNAYRSKIDDILSDPLNHITPHIDKRWHLPAYLPDINPSLVEKDLENLEKAYLLGLIAGNLRLSETDGLLVWKYRDQQGRIHSFAIGEGPVEGSFLALFKTLLHFPDRVGEILAEFPALKLTPEDFEKNCKELPQISKGDFTILDAVFKLVEKDRTEKSFESSYSLIDTLYDEINHYYLGQMGQEQPNLARNKTVELLNNILGSTETYAKARDNKWPAYEKWESRLNHLFSAE